MAFENELKHLDNIIASTVVLYIKYQCTCILGDNGCHYRDLYSIILHQ